MPRGVPLPYWLRDINEKYNGQKDQAKDRGIEWLFTLESWYQFWLESGHWHERGRKRGQYVMARFGDNGPYAVWNVKICLVAENSNEAVRPSRKGCKLSDESKAKISAKAKGRPRSEEAKRSTSATLKANVEHSKKATAIILLETQKQKGVPRTEEAKQKMREGWARRKLKQVQDELYRQSNRGYQPL